MLVLRAFVIKRVEASRQKRNLRSHDLRTHVSKKKQPAHVLLADGVSVTKGFNLNLPLCPAFERTDRIYLERKYRREEKSFMINRLLFLVGLRRETHKKRGNFRLAANINKIH